MIRNSFNTGWTVGAKANAADEWAPTSKPHKLITLPHDAMIEKERLKEGGNPSIANYPEEEYEYKKTFVIPSEYKDKRVTIEFEGIYNQARVYINGDLASHHPFGYTNFYVKADRYLQYGKENEIKVIAMSYKDSRWYSGAGIYRNTKLIISNLVHIALDGIKINTLDIDKDSAVVSIATVIENEGLSTATAYVLSEIMDEHGTVVTRDMAPITVFAGESMTLRQRMLVQEPELWSVAQPHLYTCKTTITVGEEQLDEEYTTFGIRSLSLDVDKGLRINGEVVKLRGACIHHDNGVIGAATIDRAEERRIEILKQAGFNALRSAHNPMSKAMLDACDRLGMLVMDESFDMWTITKSEYDYALNFPIWWEKDIQAMVDKDYNHPCVIMYSIGNEITETGSSIGSMWGRKLAEKIRSIDNTRFITNSINLFLASMSELKKLVQSALAQVNEEAGINTMMNTMGDNAADIITNDVFRTTTEESFACVDVAGYNYAEARYLMDKEHFPNRIIVGSETFASSIDKLWKLVQENSHVIGDFTWAGWDYLGEAGIGRVHYDLERESFFIQSQYPWLTAWVGDIDIIGNRRPISYYREIVFGLRKDPYIAVQRPEHYDKKTSLSAWGWSDSVSSWTWDSFDSKPIKVEVYADAEEVELLINGRSVGKAPAGEHNRYKAEFDTVYEAGEVTAVAYNNGLEIGRMVLHSAIGEVILNVEADRTELAASDSDLSFVMISLTDKQGNLFSSTDRKVTIDIEGPGVVQGFGSADPESEENFFDRERTTFDGMVLAVIRPTEAGTITVKVAADGCKQQTIQINAIK